MRFLERSWYQRSWITYLLIPIAYLFKALVQSRRRSYLQTKTKIWEAPVPVLIVGNINVGGTGKTPFVKALVSFLRQEGYNPGIISRGYGGLAGSYPQIVGESYGGSNNPAIVGDEPLLLAKDCKCPIVVDPNRPNAAKTLLQHFDCDIIISDDGLQHYPLGRDIEFAIIDSKRQFGNQHCLPAGPLREPLERLSCVDFIIVNGLANVDYPKHLANELRKKEFQLSLTATSFLPVGQKQQGECINALPLDQFKNEEVNAIAGIGNPARFFSTLEPLVKTVTSQAFPDHHKFEVDDLDTYVDKPLIMTSKDAIKCQSFAKHNWWYLDVKFELTDSLQSAIRAKISDALISKKEHRNG